MAADNLPGHFAWRRAKGLPSSHTDDVMALREVAWTLDTTKGRIVSPDALAMGPGDRVISAFRVAGMDFGVPPVIVVGG